MPLTKKGAEILGNMQEEYGAKKGERVFYASKNAGTIAGVDSAKGQTPDTDIFAKLDAIADGCDALNARLDKHIGFGKLKNELAHEKGVHNPGAVAAAIGREKYGAKAMAKKAAAGRKE